MRTEIKPCRWWRWWIYKRKYTYVSEL